MAGTISDMPCNPKLGRGPPLCNDPFYMVSFSDSIVSIKWIINKDRSNMAAMMLIVVSTGYCQDGSF